MQQQVRGHVPALTGVLTAVSLALVFGAALGYIPATVVPEAPGWVVDAIPHVNAAISASAIVTIALGWHWIRAGRVERHRVAMIASTVLFVGFLVLYLYRLTLLGGPEPFPGPETVYRFVYLPLLGVHILLAVVCIPLLYYVLLLAATRSVRELRRTAHARVGRVAASLWLISFALGIAVYALLHVGY
jgi:putative membrane protein